MKVSELARRVGIAPSAVRWYEEAGVIPAADRTANGYRAYGPEDLARLRIVVSLRRLGLGPLDAGRIAGLCLERGAVDLDLAPFIAEQRVAIARQRIALDRLDTELTDLEDTIAAAGRTRATRRDKVTDDTPIRVLFVCTGNSARSQMAEALLKRLGGRRFRGRIRGHGAQGRQPAHDPDPGRHRDRLVGCPEQVRGRLRRRPVGLRDHRLRSCPPDLSGLPRRHNSLHWGLEDPAEVEGSEEERLAAFRRTELELVGRIRPFIEIALRAAGHERRSIVAG